MLGSALLLAQSIAVIGTPTFRPTPVIRANVQYTVAVDSALGGVVLRDLTVPPVTFTGAIRVEGAVPFAREAEARRYADSVRFDPDGRVILVAANGERPPIRIEVEGGAGAPGGRIVLTAEGWPLNRVMVVTIEPFDIVEHHWRETGLGARDRLRVDVARGTAYITDTTAGSVTIALAFGRGARGRFETGTAELTVRRRIRDDFAEERRTVGAVTLIVEPERDNVGTARAELVFGLGRDEATASAAAQSAAAAVEGRVPAPLLRVATPEPAVQTLLSHTMAAAWPAFSAGWIPAGLSRPYSRDVAGADAATLAVQMGRAQAVCGEYARFRDAVRPDGAPWAALATRLGAQGPVRWSGDDDSGDGASRESAQILKAYACYRATRDTAWLRGELPRVFDLARRAGARSVDPLRPDAFERLAELEAEAARLAREQAPLRGDSLRNLARALRGDPGTPLRGQALWRQLTDEATRAVNGRYGRLGAADGGKFLDRVVRQLFGVDERLNEIRIAPAMDGAFNDFPWRIEGLRLYRDTLSLTYRPVDAEATVRLGALTRRRLVFAFPWLTPNACVTIRRGRQTERAMLVTMSDGTAYVDVRGAFDPAEVRIRARPCDG